MIRNQGGQSIGSQMVNASTGAAFAGTVTVYVTIDAGTQAIGSVGSGICTSEGNGYYTYRPSQAETNGTLIAFTFTGTNAIPATIQVATVTASQQEAISSSTTTIASTVRAIINDALIEIGYLQPGETPPPAIAALGLLRVQTMIDAWAADQLTLSQQLRTPYTWPANESTQTIGPSGDIVLAARPMSVSYVTYVIPGSSPDVESTPITMMDDDAYTALSIKEMSSALPTQGYYETGLGTANGTLFLWPQISAALDIYVYSPQAVTIPASLNTVLLGPSGYREAFMYQLAERMVTPCGVQEPPRLAQMARRAWQTMTRPNVKPGILTVDPALVPNSGAGYNILSDVVSSR